MRDVVLKQTMPRWRYATDEREWIQSMTLWKCPQLIVQQTQQLQLSTSACGRGRPIIRDSISLTVSFSCPQNSTLTRHWNAKHRPVAQWRPNAQLQITVQRSSKLTPNSIRISCLDPIHFIIRLPRCKVAEDKVDQVGWLGNENGIGNAGIGGGVNNKHSTSVRV